ncbi:hypothetical protein [Derxia gummosa]|uniref:Uncharacterized protein n=1 Tax=Derxia gummosa DSM 723 TaxID=1121388 RepID=A0A8B6XC03_9BURK|nr:hypothetical protein [Derxia gummosa]
MRQEATGNEASGDGVKALASTMTVPGVGAIEEVEVASGTDVCELCACTGEDGGCVVEALDLWTAIEAQFGRTCEGTGIAYMVVPAEPRACLEHGGAGCPCSAGEG